LADISIFEHERNTIEAVIASEAKQSSFFAKKEAGLLRRFAPRNDGKDAGSGE
jgi:hypothetical protein